MPTSTEPFEVLLEFTNDEIELATLSRATAITQEDTSSFNSLSSTVAIDGPMIRLYPKESISLVLNAGATYHYTLRQSARKAQLSCVFHPFLWIVESKPI